MKTTIKITLVFMAFLLLSAAAFAGCGKNDAGKQTGATSEQPSTEDPSATDEPTITDDSFFEKIKGIVDETEFSRSGDFYQNKHYYYKNCKRKCVSQKFFIMKI